MNERIKALQERYGRLLTDAESIREQYKGKSDSMKPDELQRFNGLMDEADQVMAQLEAEEKSAKHQKFLNDPVNRKGFFQDKERGGSTRDEREVKELRRVAWLKYAQHGLMGLTESEFKDLSVANPAAGGFLTVDTWLAEMIPMQKEVWAMRRISRTLPPVPVGSVISPAEDTALSDATWTTEILTGATDTVEPFGQRKLTPHSLAKRVLVSRDLMRNPNFDVEAFVRQEMAYKHGLPEEEAFVNGNGVGRPKGILQTTSLPTYTTAAATTLTADDVINWIYSLPATYANARTRILSNRSFIRRCRTLKDGVGNYVWQSGLQSGNPNTILDIPYELSDRVATGLSGTPEVWTSAAVPAVVFDPRFYWIVDALGMEIQRVEELYAATNQVGFIGRKQTDGMLVRAEAAYSLTIQ